MPTEILPVANIITELDSQWNASNVTKPVLVEATGAGAPLRIDLNRGDYVIGYPDSPTLEETPIGNWKYVNRAYNVTISIQTRVSRQRLYDLMAEVRRVCHARRHSLTNFQRLQFQAFNEGVGEQANVWVGDASIRLTNDGILAEI
jgi:hypothetical protein|tara:strand:+ start:990 stop:1427 length:438 start_codon:yes stop_codon:yes gene_type:complete